MSPSRILLLAGGAVSVALGLACGGLAGSPDGEAGAESVPPAPTSTACDDLTALPLRFAGSSAHPWPLQGEATHVLGALDGDAGTAWTAADGEVGTFYPAGASARAVRVRTDASTVEVRAFKPSRLSAPEPTPWQAVPVTDGVACGSFDQPLGAVEVRVPGGGRVRGVEVLGEGEGTVQPGDAWRIVGEAGGDGTLLAEAKNARIGEVDLNGADCVVRKPLPPPDADLRGTCTRTDAGLVIAGELPAVGAIDETLPVREVGACLVVVDGWLLSRCR